MAGFSIMAFTAWNLLDVLLIAGLAFGISRRSRTCAIIMLAYFIGSKLIMWTEQRTVAGIPMAILFGWYFFQGVRGTFAWHGMNPASAAPARPVSTGPVPKFASREEYLAWKEQRAQGGGTTATPVTDAGAALPPKPSTAAAVWSSALIAIALVAGLLQMAMAARTATSAPEPAAAEWKEFSPPDGRFSVQMPGTPVYEQKDQTTAIGPIQMHLFTLALSQDLSYLVMYSDYPEMILKAPAEKVLDGGRDGAVANAKGKLLSEQSFSLDGFPGREFVVDVQGKGILKVRVFLVRQRLYQLLVAGTNEQVDQENTMTFLQSFRLQN